MPLHSHRVFYGIYCTTKKLLKAGTPILPMLEGNLINIRVIEKEDLPVVTAWSNDPEFGGEFEPLEQNSLHEIEKWYNNLGSKEKWFIIEKKDGTKVGREEWNPSTIKI